MIFFLILFCLVVSVINLVYNCKVEFDNIYLLISEKFVWVLLDKLMCIFF